MKFRSILLASSLAGMCSAYAVPVMLGSYSFDSAAFGDTMVQLSWNGGSPAAVLLWDSDHWLNTVNNDPGAPAYLTGANFDTGLRDFPVASVQPVTLRIGYTSGILNGPGIDLGVVVARGSSNRFSISFSDGLTSLGGGTIDAASAHATGVNKTYYTPTLGTFTAELYVHEIDLSSYGIAEGTVVESVTIDTTTMSPAGLDLVRVAGVTPVPEPGTWALLTAGLAAVGFMARRRRR